MNFIHEASNLKVGGGLDDVWLTDTEELHIVDYKNSQNRKRNILMIHGKRHTKDKWICMFRLC